MTIADDFLSRQINIIGCANGSGVFIEKLVCEVIFVCNLFNSALVRREQELAVIGGDHSCAIGTWSGIASALRPKGNVGLIWVDAHLDSHRPETSVTGNLHGMPVAHLLDLSNLIATEIVEFLPRFDDEQKTRQFLFDYDNKFHCFDKKLMSISSKISDHERFQAHMAFVY
uniref:Arginase n=1 Tax=Parascaris equorum TaxID=6256 RepID=A0A914R473_PAREQ